MDRANQRSLPASLIRGLLWVSVLGGALLQAAASRGDAVDAFARGVAARLTALKQRRGPPDRPRAACLDRGNRHYHEGHAHGY